ncbi:hypothetical protein ACFV5G_38330, partial [Streptomyces sp. NPDC059766]|uniref:hypothetical protein n=1 Tax=Streptomyces sp. NPDC059766 TaxID=3346940 RepID=UPI0036699B82
GLALDGLGGYRHPDATTPPRGYRLWSFASYPQAGVSAAGGYGDRCALGSRRTGSCVPSARW